MYHNVPNNEKISPKLSSLIHLISLSYLTNTNAENYLLIPRPLFHNSPTSTS